MRVASYNIRKTVGLDWRRDPERIVDILAEIDADVVVLQEADRRIGTRCGVLPLDRLAGDLGLFLSDASLRPHSHGWHGNAILLKSRFEGHTPNRIDLPSMGRCCMDRASTDITAVCFFQDAVNAAQAQRRSS